MHSMVAWLPAWLDCPKLVVSHSPTPLRSFVHGVMHRRAETADPNARKVRPTDRQITHARAKNDPDAKNGMEWNGVRN